MGQTIEIDRRGTMFSLIFGSGMRFKVLGLGHSNTCRRCATTTWTHVRRSRELTLFLVPIARWGHRELEVCPVCGEERELDESSIDGCRPVRPARS